MKRLGKFFLLMLIAATSVFMARGSGHVPRQLLLISSPSDIVSGVDHVIAVIPAPAPLAVSAAPDYVVSIIRVINSPQGSDPALPSQGNRSPPASSRSLLS